MLASTGIFWSGIIGNALSTAGGASTSLEELLAYLSCMYETSDQCAQVLDDLRVSSYYLNTVAVVIVVCTNHHSLCPFKN